MEYNEKDFPKRIYDVLWNGNLMMLLRLNPDKLKISNVDNVGMPYAYIRMLDCKRGEKWNTAFDNLKFHFFGEFENGQHSTEGYTRLSFYPSIANYFPNVCPPVTFNDWSALKKNVDEDYKNAVDCRNLLIQAVKEIQEDEQNYLMGIRELKASSKES
jgi:hypothetical protein